MPRRSTAVARPLVLVRESPTPCFMLNARRQVVLFNRGCEWATGWTAEDVLGQRTEHVTESDPHTVAALLATISAPSGVWSGEPGRQPVDLPHRTEESQPKLIHYWPIRDEDQNSIAAVMGCILPVPTPSESEPLSIAQKLHAELAALRSTLRRTFGEKNVIAKCPAMQRVLQQVRVAQGTAAPVLLTGAAGTGKEHFARMIHYGSPTGRRPFVPLDCRLTPSFEIKRVLRQIREEPRSAADSPLRPGALYFADIDAAPTDVQERIAEFLIPGQEPLGVRILAGTTVPLMPLVDSEKFLLELWHRLQVLTIDLPPLSARLDDLGPLAQFFLEEHNRGSDRQVAGFSEAAWEQLRRYPWPGNLDELQRVITAAYAQATGSEILPEQLPLGFRSGVDAFTLGPTQPPPLLPLDVLLEQVEREQIELAIATAKGHMTRAADLLQIPRARLYRRMQQLGLETHEQPS